MTHETWLEELLVRARKEAPPALEGDRAAEMLTRALEYSGEIADDLHDLVNPVTLLSYDSSDQMMLSEVLRAVERVQAPKLADDDAESMIAIALAGVSRDAAPLSLSKQSETSGHDIVAREIATNDIEAKRSRNRGVPYSMWAVIAAAAVVLLAFAWSSRSESVASKEFTTASLPTGDRITGSPDAAYQLASVTSKRAIKVTEGTVLFDVMPLEASESFTVESEDITVSVTGTVFSVEQNSKDVSVRVYEGEVHVTKRDREWTLRAGQMWQKGRVVNLTENVLAEAGQHAANLRNTLAESGRTVRNETQESPVRNDKTALIPRRVVEDTRPEMTEQATLKPERTEQATLRPEMTEQTSLTPTNIKTTLKPAKQRTLESKKVPQEIAVSNLSIATSLLANKDFEAALQKATLACTSSCNKDWHATRAKALRGLARYSESAQAYEDAAKAGMTVGWYQSGRLHFHQLRDDQGALAALSHVTHRSSPVAERALGLSIRALQRSGQQKAAISAAKDYIERYPEGGYFDYVQSLVTPKKATPKN